MLRSTLFFLFALTGGWASAQFDCVDPDLIDPDAFCLDIYEPVCGCDGVTYSNDCYAVNVGGVTSFTNGECGQAAECLDLAGVDFGLCDMAMGIAVIDGTCTFISGCGWIVDGVDYQPYFFDSFETCQSQCEGNLCVDVGNVDFGDCDMDMGVAIVFGTCMNVSGCGWQVEGVNYEPYFFPSIDECNAACGNQMCVDQSVVDLEFDCNFDIEPVCGCDSLTYVNACQAYYFHGVTSVTAGPCSCYDENVIDSTMVCLDVWDPVCGCDDVTYSNACYAFFQSGITSYVPGECATSVQEMEGRLAQIYPNPAQEFIVIESLQRFELIVYNSLGQQIAWRIGLHGQVQLNTSELNMVSGLFLIEVRTMDGQSEKHRVLVK